MQYIWHIWRDWAFYWSSRDVEINSHIFFSYLLIKCKFKHLTIILTIHINLKSQLTLTVWLCYRRDISAIDQLPKYMKVCYRALLDIYYEMEEILGEERSYRIRYAIEAVSIIHINLEISCNRSNNHHLYICTLQ